MATIDDVRDLGSSLERSYEVLVRDRVKFRVGAIVYVAFSRDERMMGFGFPKLERDGVDRVRAGEVLPAAPVRPAVQLGRRAARCDPRRRGAELVVDVWRMVVPQKVWRADDLLHPHGPNDP